MCSDALMSAQVEPVIDVRGISKCYRIYPRSSDRLRQFLLPQLRRALALPQQNYFREFWALRDIALQVRQGETVGIVGRNGSGKSTLLQLICGTLSPERGEIVTRGRISALLELGSGFNPEFSGAENVRLYGAVLGLSSAELESKYKDILAFAGIGDFIDQPLRTYSSGMSMRLAFAVAVSVDPQILIVDEALAVGDELFQRKCYARIRHMRDNGASILFVSHSGGQVIELCDRAMLLDDGECLGVGNPRDIVTGYHRLLHARSDSRQADRERIRNELASQSLAAAVSGSLATSVVPTDVRAVSPQPPEYLDPNLVPASTVMYETRGARIDRPVIRTTEGRDINALVCGRQYVYEYGVTFNRDCFDVRFGMLIKSTTGTDLGAMGSAPAGGGIPRVVAGSVLKVRFRFLCQFLPGTYFMNAGCNGLIDGQDVFLHRLVDVVCFRVLPQMHQEPRAGHVELSAGIPSAEWEAS